jgi:hypothetical protein
MTERDPPSAALLAVLAQIFAADRRGSHPFDERIIASAVRDHPELLTALAFLDVDKVTTGWRTGSLSKESRNRVKQWLGSVSGRVIDGFAVERDFRGQYRIVPVRRIEAATAGKAAGPPVPVDNQEANASLLAILADIFWPGRPGGSHFDHRRISLEVRTHPELFAALVFLGVQKLTTGWRAGSLSEDSVNRIAQWLSAIEGREIDGRQLERDAGRYRVTLLRQDELPPFC